MKIPIRDRSANLPVHQYYAFALQLGHQGLMQFPDIREPCFEELEHL